MNQNTELTLEQKFRLQVLKKEVHSLTLEEFQEYLLEMLPANDAQRCVDCQNLKGLRGS